MPSATDAAVAIIVFIGIWMVVGVVSDVSGIAIYEDFPRKPFYPTSAYSITVKNNSPAINPLIVPLYLVSIQPNNNSCAILWPGAPSCNQSIWDAGKIDSGGQTSFPLTLSPGAGNFTISVFVYLNLWNTRIPSGSRTIHFQHLANGTYLMRG